MNIKDLWASAFGRKRFNIAPALAAKIAERRAPQAEPEPPPDNKTFWHWNNLTVRATTKSEARSEFKRLTFLKRLPPGAVVSAGKAA